MREYVAPCCVHTPYDYFDFNLSVGVENWLRNCIFRNIHVCDLL